MTYYIYRYFVGVTPENAIENGHPKTTVTDAIARKMLLDFSSEEENNIYKFQINVDGDMLELVNVEHPTTNKYKILED